MENKLLYNLFYLLYDLSAIYIYVYNFAGDKNFAGVKNLQVLIKLQVFIKFIVLVIVKEGGVNY